MVIGQVSSIIRLLLLGDGSPAAKAAGWMSPCGTTKEAAEKLHRTRKGDKPGLKPAQISGNLRGPEGPLFHGDARIREFFRNL
jgi:hypothetical protein